MKGKSKRKPGGKRTKKAAKKTKPAEKAEEPNPPDKPPLEVVRDEEPPPGPPPEVPSDVDGAVEPPAVRPLNPVHSLQYRFAMLQEELVGEKKENIALKRVLLGKDAEILDLRKETADLKEIVVNREERDLFNTNATLLRELGVGEDEEVLIESGCLFVAPKGTAQKRSNG